MRLGDVIERGRIRGIVVSNDRDGLFIMSTTGWHMQIPGSRVRVLSEADGSLYSTTKRRAERHWQRFMEGDLLLKGSPRCA